MRRSLTYQPALDGLRGVAVALVVLFHMGFGWMSGGYVGVSVFFTLSGFLITSLILAEHDSSGAVDVGAFYGRRIRRLLPASLTCLTGVAVAARLGAFDGVAHLRRDLLGSLFQVQNWVALSGDASYSDLINRAQGKVSPLEHYWSLAIEEQFYWLWPLVMLLVCRRLTGRSRVVALGGLAAAATISAPIVAHVWGPDAAYWSTPSRIGEILVGAALAAVLRYVPRVQVGAQPWLGVLALAVIIWAGIAWPSGSGPAYTGLMPLFALASAAVILALQTPSLLTRALSVAPLRGLGVISYGVYLFHWPIFALLSAGTVTANPWGLAAVRVGVTLAVALASFFMIERPARNARWPVSRTLALAAAGSCALVVVAVVVVPRERADVFAAGSKQGGQLLPADSVSPLALADVSAPTSSTIVNANSIKRESEAVGGTGLPGPTTVPAAAAAPEPALPPLSRPVRVLIAGDSTAWAAGDGLIAWAEANPTLAQVSMAVDAGCGFIRAGSVPVEYSARVEQRCADLLDHRLPDSTQSLKPDVVMLMTTFRDIDDRVWDPAEGALTPGDPRFRERMLAEYRQITRSLLDQGAQRVAWVKAPMPEADWSVEASGRSDATRYAVRDAVIDQVVAEFPQSRVIDFRSWYRTSEFAHDEAARPDGVHWPLAAATAIADQYLGMALVRAAVLP